MCPRLTDHYSLSDHYTHGTARTYYESGGVFEEAKFEYGTPKFMRVYREDGKLSEQKGWIDNKIIERIVG